ncbi:MAG: Ig-like domain-containing protein, partial [Longimicrobiales bacterium]
MKRSSHWSGRTLTILVLAAAAGCADASSPETPFSPGSTIESRFVRVTPDRATITEVGQRLSLSASVHDARGNAMSGSAIQWRSLRREVAIVDGDGQVTAIGAGTAHIEAKSRDAADTARITVAEGAVAVVQGSVVITPAADTIPSIGASVELVASVRDVAGYPLGGLSVSWSSLDANIAEVGEAGRVAGLAPGVARIVARHAQFTDTARVWVAPSTKTGSIQIMPMIDTVAVGKAMQLSALVRDIS